MSSAEALLDEAYDRRVSTPGSTSWRNFWLMLLAASLPLMVPYFLNLWQKDYYQYFPFVLLAVGWLLYSRWDRSFNAPRGWFCWLIIATGLVSIVAGVSLASPWLGAIGFVAVLSAFLISSHGEYDKSLIAVALPLILLIQVPLGYDQQFVVSLQKITTSLSSVLLDLLSIPHAVNNNVIQLTTRELFVAEACSGIQSVFTLMFLATLLIVLNRRPLWLAPVYILIATLLAIAGNVVRVSMVAIGDVWFNLDLAIGWEHELVGYFALGMGILFLLSFDQMLVSMMHPVETESSERNPIIDIWNHLSAARLEEDALPIEVSTSDDESGLWSMTWPRRIIVSACCVVCLASLVQAYNIETPKYLQRTASEAFFQPNPELFRDSLSVLSVTSHDVARGGSNPRLGDNADIWTCDFLGTKEEAQFVVSQPYREWHELCVCYENLEWRRIRREIQSSKGNESEPFVLAQFRRGNNSSYLLYSAISEEGNIVSPPWWLGAGNTQTGENRPAMGRLATRFFAEEEYDVSQIMMIQMFVTADSKLPKDSLDGLIADFVEMRSKIQKNVKAPQNTPIEQE